MEGGDLKKPANITRHYWAMMRADLRLCSIYPDVVTAEIDSRANAKEKKKVLNAAQKPRTPASRTLAM